MKNKYIFYDTADWIQLMKLFQKCIFFTTEIGKN